MEILKNPNFDIIGKARYFIALSVLVIVAGGVWMQRNGLLFGVEFQGGTQLIAHFSSAPDLKRIRGAVEEVAPGAVIQTYDVAAKNQVLIRVAVTNEADITATTKKALAALETGYPENKVAGYSSETVGPVVGGELSKQAVRLVVLGLLCQLIYIGFRFKGAIWGTAATIAVLHDVLVTLSFLSFAGYEITLNVIAALLTLVGYSVNDTIVIFDRARENLRQKRKDPISKILNDSLNQTLTRTLISNGTTFLAILALYLFGGEALRGFGFTMVVGAVVGTYSTIYIASPIVILWDRLRSQKAPAKA
jgi:preprotein translocase subunit SecF